MARSESYIDDYELGSVSRTEDVARCREPGVGKLQGKRLRENHWSWRLTRILHRNRRSRSPSSGSAGRRTWREPNPPAIFFLRVPKTSRVLGLFRFPSFVVFSIFGKPHC